MKQIIFEEVAELLEEKGYTLFGIELFPDYQLFKVEKDSQSTTILSVGGGMRITKFKEAYDILKENGYVEQLF